MSLIKSIKGVMPIIAENVFLAENSTIIGSVKIGENSSVWFSVVIRADVNSIKIGQNVNIQDGTIVHCTFQKSSTVIGNNVSIGHNSIIHGCTIHDNVLVGMGSIIMDNVIIESNSIIAAGSVLLEGTRVKSGELYAGLPAKKVKDLNINETSQLVKNISDNYLLYSSWYDN